MSPFAHTSCRLHRARRTRTRSTTHPDCRPHRAHAHRRLHICLQTAHRARLLSPTPCTRTPHRAHSRLRITHRSRLLLLLAPRTPRRLPPPPPPPDHVWPRPLLLTPRKPPPMHLPPDCPPRTPPAAYTVHAHATPYPPLLSLAHTAAYRLRLRTAFAHACTAHAHTAHRPPCYRPHSPPPLSPALRTRTPPLLPARSRSRLLSPDRPRLLLLGQPAAYHLCLRTAFAHASCRPHRGCACRRLRLRLWTACLPFVLSPSPRARTPPTACAAVRVLIST